MSKETKAVVVAIWSALLLAFCGFAAGLQFSTKKPNTVACTATTIGASVYYNDCVKVKK